MTLKALANVLHDYPQDVITRDDYFRLLGVDTAGQRWGVTAPGWRQTRAACLRSYRPVPDDPQPKRALVD